MDPRITAIYARVSTDKQTTANQVPGCLDLARSRGWDVVEMYTEQQSAVKHRPIFNRMMEDAVQKRFAHLIVWRLDRFGRQMQGNINDVLALDRAGVDVVSVMEPWLDAQGPARNLLLAIFSWLAEEERRVLVQRLRAGQERARREGKQIGWPSPTPERVAAAAARFRAGALLRDAAAAEGVGVRALRMLLAHDIARDIASGVTGRAAARKYRLNIRTVRSMLAHLEHHQGAEQRTPSPAATGERRAFLPFDEARKFAHSLRLTSSIEFRSWCLSDAYRLDVPTQPNEYYHAYWNGWADWLGCQARTFLPFAQARGVARELGLHSVREWWAWCRKGLRPTNLPYDPREQYRGQFIGWHDWLGYLRKRFLREEMMPFIDARRHARRLGLRSEQEWWVWARTSARPRNIPYHPQLVYLAQWNGWPDWLGYSAAVTRMRSFRKARAFARSQGHRSCLEWRAWARSPERPRDIPAKPEQTYAEWRGWPDWLGKSMLPFRTARAMVRRLGLKSNREWYRWAMSKARPPNIPFNPSTTYRNQYRGMPDWLGYPVRRMLRFTAARSVARSLNLRSRGEWIAWARRQRPRNIPVDPSATYAASWRGWRDWLGHVRV
jgi:DNA invertase Pin-like site-specific DNA recombinase